MNMSQRSILAFRAMEKRALKAEKQLKAERQRVVELEEHSKKLYEGFHQERQRADNASFRENHLNDMLNDKIQQNVDLRAELAALKGDQVPVAAGTTEECSPDVYAKGISACLVDIPKEKAEVICRGISAASGVAVDWHYVGGRVHIKAMRVTAPQKPVVLPGKKALNPNDPSPIWWGSKEWNSAIDACRAAIEAAGGKVAE